ncbi:hypothetical protein DB30_07566 [Enhygromyxa salina]|uniref:Lipoprotein n=1 Tax=Enhygromyxa salina TaxID=215803 RepID=A0A0C2CVU2_9BACT|nr:hypothetical protein [Enhygromyxa salina]KIG13720.1 hypothetical protein DB30_07566 [Enhygromyxa salina]
MERRLLLSLSLAALACSPGGIGASGEDLGDDGSTSGGDSATSETDTSETDDGCGPTNVADPQAEIDQAIADLDVIVAANLAWFAEAREQGLDSQGNPYAPHRCPHPDGVSSGEAGPTPVISLDCNDAPDGRCAPWHGDWMEIPEQPGYYDGRLWFLNAMWFAAGFAKTEAHAFHYNLIVDNQPDEFGDCTFTVSAQADLDADFVFSTYERRGHIDNDGVQLEALFIDKPCE